MRATPSEKMIATAGRRAAATEWRSRGVQDVKAGVDAVESAVVSCDHAVWNEDRWRGSNAAFLSEVMTWGKLRSLDLQLRLQLMKRDGSRIASFGCLDTLGCVVVLHLAALCASYG